MTTTQTENTINIMRRNKKQDPPSSLKMADRGTLGSAAAIRSITCSSIADAVSLFWRNPNIHDAQHGGYRPNSIPSWIEGRSPSSSLTQAVQERQQ